MSSFPFSFFTCLLGEGCGMLFGKTCGWVRDGENSVLSDLIRRRCVEEGRFHCGRYKYTAINM